MYERKAYVFLTIHSRIIVCWAWREARHPQILLSEKCYTCTQKNERSLLLNDTGFSDFICFFRTLQQTYVLYSFRLSHCMHACWKKLYDHFTSHSTATGLDSQLSKGAELSSRFVAVHFEGGSVLSLRGRQLAPQKRRGYTHGALRAIFAAIFFIRVPWTPIISGQNVTGVD